MISSSWRHTQPDMGQTISGFVMVELVIAGPCPVRVVGELPSGVPCVMRDFGLPVHFGGE